jgi:hypothetical protein
MSNTIHVIFDDRHIDDKQRLLLEFEEQGIEDFRFWSAVVNKDSVVDSIAHSHKMIVQYALDNNLDEICIAEQDLTFTCPTAWGYFIENKPKEFDIYLASTYILPISNNKICGFHLYIVRKQFYYKLLGIGENQHIDTACCDLGGDFKFCYPFPALQRAGFSANTKTMVNYNSLISEQDIYKG